MIYIDAETFEYPRFEGDVALEPDRPWQQVIETAMPINDDPLMVAEEIEPKLVNGIWTQQWNVRKKTVLEIERDKKPPKNWSDLE